MGYTDAQGRPELVVNPRIKLGLAGYRTVATPASPTVPDPEAESAVDTDTAPAPAPVT